MKKVLILGAGMVTKPMVDYFLDKCNYHVVMATRTISKAEKIINERPNAEAVKWTTDDLSLLDDLVKDSDIVLSMIPPTQHIPVAEACLRHKKNMVTTSYLNPTMIGLHEKATEQDIIILNEIGEDPGIDHMGAKQMIDEIKEEGGRVLSLTSYGAGLPAFEFNRNPFGYKFSWSPKGVIMAARSPAAFLKEGKRVDVPAEVLFDNHWLVDIEGLGTFETYPNRDSTRYKEYFGLDDDVSLYRGLLRFTGWCNTIRAMKKLNLLNDDETHDFEGKTYREFTESITEISSASGGLAEFLNVEEIDDIVERLKWLGLIDNKKIDIKEGTNADLLVGLMLKKMSYGEDEKDMIIIHDEIIAGFGDRLEKRMSTMRVEGIPYGDSAMSRAVSLPAAIAARHILENKITVKGVHIPVLKEIYAPVLEELETFGFKFKHMKRETDKDEA